MADSIASSSSPAPASPAGKPEATPVTPFASTDWAALARPIIFGSLALAVIALIVVLVAIMQESSRKAAVRQNWDAVYLALKDKTKPEERIQELEKIAEKVKGTATHAWVLMELGDAHMQQAVRPERAPEDRAASLKKSIDVYKLVASQEPYRSNPYFGPLAIECAALGLEQARDYDGAIALLSDALGRTDLETHFLYNKLMAQLGRVYWMRSLKAAEEKKSAKEDEDKARKYLTDALRASAGKEDAADMKWREQAEYIKSLLDPVGKALPDGKIPPEKPKPEPKPEEKKAEDRSAEPKKDEAKKDDAKKDESKKEDKKEEKKSDAATPEKKN